MKSKKADIKMIVGIIIALVAMFLIIRVFSSNLIDSSDEFKFCKDSVDWNENGIPDRMESCVCKDEARCNETNCIQERNKDLGCDKVESS